MCALVLLSFARRRSAGRPEFRPRCNTALVWPNERRANFYDRRGEGRRGGGKWKAKATWRSSHSAGQEFCVAGTEPRRAIACPAGRPAKLISICLSVSGLVDDQHWTAPGMQFTKSIRDTCCPARLADSQLNNHPSSPFNCVGESPAGRRGQARVARASLAF